MKKIFMIFYSISLMVLGCDDGTTQPINNSQPIIPSIQSSKKFVVKPSILYELETLQSPIKYHLNFITIAHGSVTFHTDHQQWIALWLEVYNDGVKLTGRGTSRVECAVKGDGSFSIMIPKPYKCGDRLHYRMTTCIDTELGPRRDVQLAQLQKLGQSQTQPIAHTHYKSTSQPNSAAPNRLSYGNAPGSKGLVSKNYS